LSKIRSACAVVLRCHEGHPGYLVLTDAGLLAPGDFHPGTTCRVDKCGGRMVVVLEGPMTIDCAPAESWETK